MEVEKFVADVFVPHPNLDLQLLVYPFHVLKLCINRFLNISLQWIIIVSSFLCLVDVAHGDFFIESVVIVL